MVASSRPPAVADRADDVEVLLLEPGAPDRHGRDRGARTDAEPGVVARANGVRDEWPWNSATLTF
jgi:predicted NUDIX family NTP pyrophosphohydrolase